MSLLADVVVLLIRKKYYLMSTLQTLIGINMVHLIKPIFNLTNINETPCLVFGLKQIFDIIFVFLEKLKLKTHDVKMD